MAEAAVEFLLENLGEFLKYKTNQLTKGQEVVRWIEDELETLISQLEGIEGDQDQPVGNLKKAIPKAEDLAETYTKREIQRDAATFKRPIYTIRTWDISLKLHRIQKEIVGYTKRIPSLVPSPQQHPPEQTNSLFRLRRLRRCMHYFLLFRPDSQVPARRLIVLWVAEGLARSNKRDDDESAEQIAQGYLNELRRQGKIRVVEDKSSGKLTCSIDADSRNELMEESKTADFLQDGNGMIRRLVDRHHDTTATTGDSSSSSFIQIHGNATILDSVPNYKDVISFLSFNTQEGSKPGEDIGDFLRRCISAGCFTWLRLLDLERVFRPKLPDTLGKLIALKYLGLRWTYLEQLPDSVDKLLNLRVLDVKRTYISVLPRSIWRMQYLLHLYLSEAYRTRFPDPPSKVTLTSLQTLWGAFVDEDTPVAGGLDKLLNIRKLGMSCRSTESKQLKDIDRWISNLKYLESLRLKSRDENNDASDLHLSSLATNLKLSTLYLLGKLESLLICKLPASLTSITLSGSELDLNPMRILGRLPNLMNLRLLGKAVVSNRMCCSKRGFRKLKLLWIWKLENLKELEAEEGSLPSLEELEIRSCHNLEKLPDRLQQLQNLEVTLTSMKQEFLLREKSKYAKCHVSADQLILKTPLTTLAQKGKGKQVQL